MNPRDDEYIFQCKNLRAPIFQKCVIFLSKVTRGDNDTIAEDNDDNKGDDDGNKEDLEDDDDNEEDVRMKSC